jgi:predicted small lipoprotein YifL
MIIFNKKYFFSTILILSLILLFLVPACGKKGPGYNPYLHSKTRQREAHSAKKLNDKRTKNYRKQLRKSRRQVFGSPTPPTN